MFIRIAMEYLRQTYPLMILLFGTMGVILIVGYLRKNKHNIEKKGE